MEEADDLTADRSALEAVHDAEYVELPEGSVAIVAAEVVAAAVESGRQDLPPEGTHWLTTTNDLPPLDDRNLILRAIPPTRSGDPELAELWKQADDPSRSQEVGHLIARLEVLAGRSTAWGHGSHVESVRGHPDESVGVGVLQAGA